MLRRPPGQVAPTGNGRYLLALAVILLPWLQLVEAQHEHSHNTHQSPPESHDRHVAASLVSTTATPLTGHHVETPISHARRKSTVSDDAGVRPPSRSHSTYIPHDASAHLLAPDLSVRAGSSSALKANTHSDVGLSQQHIARSLEDWEVEDYVLLATVDGDIHATDRQTGHVRWHLKADHPMVETRHFRVNRSELEDDFDPADHYIWVVEPTRDGDLYVWRPNENGLGLTKMGLTMKKIVEDLVGKSDKVNGVVYTGDKKTTLVTVDAATGVIMKQFGTSGTYINKVKSKSCPLPVAIADGGNEECANAGTITLARTEYTVIIHHIEGDPIASLKYSEWGPNGEDHDLIQQNRQSKDGRYVTGKHDGTVYGFDLGRSSRDKRPMFIKSLSSPVARVFDVLRDASTTEPDLVVLPQAPIPDDQHQGKFQNEQVFINQTEAGSWYALSEARYPLIVHASPAPIDGTEWWMIQGSGMTIDDDFMSKAMVGIHKLPSSHANYHDAGRPSPSGLPGPDPSEKSGLPEEDGKISHDVAAPLPSNVADTLGKLPQHATDKLIELLSNPWAIAMLVLFAIAQITKSRLWKSLGKTLHQPQIEVKPTVRGVVTDAQPAPVEKEVVVEPATKPVDQAPQVEIIPDNAPLPEVVTQDALVPTAPVVVDDVQEVPAQAPAPDGSPIIPGDQASPGDTNSGQEPPKKKKAHRGRRGGAKHKKGNQNNAAREGSQSRDDDPPEASVQEVINKAKQLGVEPQLEPDILTVSNGVEEVSGPILKMGSLEVNEEQQLGTGSNGTVVFAGKWDGRDVAVKRMLVQFNEIASQETKLLRESDDHPNVIRYFAQQQRAAFLYIALELCQASLADVIQKPSQFRELAQAGERDMPNVLYQVANGLSHLHSLRIVHRDLKPQNILVNMGKNGKPRLLVSDFGLCKKLEGGQSSFGATTAHAAGTSGWRAPELLVDDDGPINTSMTLDTNSSLHSTSGSGIIGAELAGPNPRRVTRAIDIFSLGLVFFYVLTKGCHPFDCGDRYMREVNIRKGNFRLEALDALGDFAEEAKDLIRSMLAADPKARPSARDVMSHPFFWSAKKRLSFLCDVSDHFEKEQRDPPSPPLAHLEEWAGEVIDGDFLKKLPREFVDSLGKQRKYSGGKMLDLLRALRNKRNHYEDMPESLRKVVGSLPDGYLGFWTRRFPHLLLACWNVVYNVEWDRVDRFREYYEPAGL